MSSASYSTVIFLCSTPRPPYKTSGTECLPHVAKQVVHIVDPVFLEASVTSPLSIYKTSHTILHHRSHVTAARASSQAQGVELRETSGFLLLPTPAGLLAWSVSHLLIYSSASSLLVPRTRALAPRQAVRAPQAGNGRSLGTACLRSFRLSEQKVSPGATFALPLTG